MLQSWLKTGTLRKRKSSEEHVPSRVVELEQDNEEEEVDLNQREEPSIAGPAAPVSGNEGGPRSPKRSGKPTRKYDPNYLKLGFTWTGTEAEPIPQCVVCGRVLSKGSMKPAHLKRHLETRHEKIKDKPLEFFQNKLRSLREAKSDISSAATPVARAQECSYRASLRIAKAGKPHTIGEELCLPMAKEMTRIMCVGKRWQKGWI